MKEKLNYMKRWGGIFLLLMVFSLNATAQVQVRGSVLDEHGEGAIGATIQIKGTSQGTVTDNDGNFTLSAPAGSILVFSYVGYETQEHPAAASMRIVLTPDSELLEELVVVGFGSMRRSEITAAVSSLNSDNFNTTAAPAGVLELARGRIPGVTITNVHGSDPRQDISIQIRGAGSLRGSTSPLIIIDGVPNGNLNSVAPEDIESFVILKDASAAAIYGTRGANGVVLITTKRAARGDIRTRFEYSNTLAHEYIYRMPRILTADEYRDYMGSGRPGADLMRDLGDSVDWPSLLHNSGNFSHTHSFAVSGGNSNGNYRASMYYRDNDPIAIRSDQQRWGGRLSINSIGLNQRLEFSMNASADLMTRDNVGTRGAWEQAAQRNPTGPAKNPDGTWFEDGAYNSWNPLAQYSTREDVTHRKTWTGSARATVNIVDGLRASVMGSWQQWDQNRNQYLHRDSRTSIESFGGGGRAQKWYEKDIQQTIETTLDFQRVFNKIHSFNAVAGHSYEYGVRESFDVMTSGFMTDAFGTNNMGNGTGFNDTQTNRRSVASNKYDAKLAAFFGRVNYILMNKYQFQATFRHEGSSRFGRNSRWGNFPSISAGWVMSQENFIKDNFEFIDFLKLRGGFGVTGTQPHDNYLYMSTLSGGGRQPLDDSGVWQETWGPSRNPNPDLKWEKREELNVGLEFTLLKHRLSGTIDVYRRMTKDLLENARVPQPPFIHDQMMVNVGTIRNSGIEVGLNATAIQTKNFSWDVTANYFYQSNKLVSLSNDFFMASHREFGSLPSPGALGNAIRTEEGHPLGMFYGKRFAGFTQPNENGVGGGQWLFYNKDNEVITLGEVKPDDMAYIGNGVPKHNASLINNFRYKNFDLSIMLRGKFAFDILNLHELYFGNVRWLPNNVLKSAITRHSELNDAPQYSDYYLERGDFVKLDNITLGYNFRPRNQDWVRNLRVYVAGTNLVTFTNYTGPTPEVQDTGLTPGISNRDFFPVSSTLIFGLNIAF